jgi:hypothetical protein
MCAAGAALVGCVLVLASSPARAADGAAAPFVLPHGPAKAGFDVSRANFSVHGAFDPFVVETTVPLRDALKHELVASDTDVLLTDTATGPIALLVEQMAYHHLAQGRAGGQDWLVSFCVVCNTGTRLMPSVNGKPTRFAAAGIYDGMMLMQDAATGSIWDHVTGEALYGPAVGATLGEPGNVLQVTVKQALAMGPDTRIAISDRSYFAGGRRHGSLEGISLLGRTQARPDNRAGLSDVFIATLGHEDARRPRMDLGLGIWSGTGSRYYPRDLIRRHGDALIDAVEGRHLLVYIDPDTSTPAAIFVTAAAASVHGSTVRLDNRQTVRNGVLFDANGRRMAAERPRQVFTRWYGFALTFPGTTVYGP